MSVEKVHHHPPTLTAKMADSTPRSSAAPRERTEFRNYNDEDAAPVHHLPENVQFSMLTSEEIKKLSACEVDNPVSFNNLQHPLKGGLYDLRMGPFSDRDDIHCQTCLLSCDFCPGHLGHINLPLPVVNPLYHYTILKLAKLSCLTCGKFRMPEYGKQLFVIRMKLLDLGLIVSAQTACEVVDNSLEENESGKKKKKRNNNADVGITNKLMEFYEQEVELAKSSENLQEELRTLKNTRNTEDLKKVYRKDFLDFGKGGRGGCPHCGTKVSGIVLHKSRIKFEGINTEDYDEAEMDEDESRGKKILKELNPGDIKKHLRKLWAEDPEVLLLLFPMFKDITCEFPTDVFLVDTLAVPPPKTRPCMFAGGILTMHPQTSGLQYVLESVTVLKHILMSKNKDPDFWSKETTDVIKTARGNSIELKLDFIWRELQSNVDQVLDKEMKTDSKNKVGWGFKQLIERKQGIFRMHMMGKRVNFAARTVITPDPNINVDEIGLPEVFAKTLTYREAVTPHNVEKLRQMVLNGPHVHPGANILEEGNGFRRVIDGENPIRREAMAKTLLTPGQNEGETKYVHRHLINGDAMLLNRQPTLHRPSIMSHRARVLKGEKVMRLHYATCKSYNADFDGDEMNAHFPQNEVARSESYNIVNVCRNYLVPKDGSPLQGLIQDHIIAGVKMTMRGRFFTRSEYQQLVYGALVEKRGMIRTVLPAILRPEPLWSGKQIITTIIINLVPKDKEPPTLESSAKIKNHEWVRETPRVCEVGGMIPQKKDKFNTTMSESEVIFRQGEFVSGILDKNQYGATAYSLVHSFFELYGGTFSAGLLSCFSKIFTNFLKTEGFTLGVHDIVVKSSANKTRKKVIKSTRKLGKLMASNGVSLAQPDETNQPEEEHEAELASLLEQFHRESRLIPKKRMDIDRAYKEKLAPATNDINKVCLPKGLVKTFPENNLQLMVQAGAKGSTVNTMQISCLLGQIELEGKRPPLMLSGKSLPSFVPYDVQPRAGGFIDGRFMTGIRPQEFFFHCMAGREGLIDTACKTSRSGYLQRCLIKLLEGLTVHYDMTVRDSDGSVVQFQYGEDCQDVCKYQYMKKEQFDFLYENKKSVVESEKAIEMAKRYSVDSKKLESHSDKVRKWKKRNQNARKFERNSGFLLYSESRLAEMKIEMDNLHSNKDTKEKLKGTLVTEWHNLKKDEESSKLRAKFEKKAAKCPDTMNSIFRPDSNFGSITERMDSLINQYIQEKLEEKCVGFDPVSFRELIYMKNMKCSVDAGEPVGILAAQSVGEPSTQMTLNTFHFAGRGEMNVTLGIPRLREILMVASPNIKTPSMVIPFLDGVSEKNMNALRIHLNRVTMADVLEQVTVEEMIRTEGTRQKLITLRFEFLPRRYYKDKFGVTPTSILDYFENKFIAKVLFPVIKGVLTEKTAVVESQSENASNKKISKKSGTGDEEPDSPGNNKENENFDKAEKRAGGGEAHESSDEEELPDDADATESRKKSRQNDEIFDEGLSDEEEEMIRDLTKMLDEEEAMGDQTMRTSAKVDEGFAGSDEEEENESESEDQTDKRKSEKSRQKSEMETNADAQRRRLAVMNLNSKFTRVANYSYDTAKEHWCELTLAFKIGHKTFDMTNIVRKAAEKAVIKEVKNIKRSFLTKDNKDRHTLTVDGINIEAMFHQDELLDLNKLSCNNIHDMAKFYGIEAANRTIVREIVNVFAAYGIDVDPHHLTLIADYMTFDGTYKPFNRIGIENNPSPLQQMTFETAIGFLRNATLSGKIDSLNSPSSCIVLGKPCFGGSNSFSLRQNFNGIF